MDILDFEELMAYLVCHDDESIDIDDKFVEKYGINTDKAFVLVKDLLPLCFVSKSDLTNKTYQGFAGGGYWLAKNELILKRAGS